MEVVQGARILRSRFRPSRPEIDPTTLPENTVLPVYKRLIEAGAKDIHLSYYDHEVDITDFYGGEDYRYNDHWSWIYSYANQCRLDYYGSTVELDGRPVRIMDWMAAQSKQEFGWPHKYI